MKIKLLILAIATFIATNTIAAQNLEIDIASIRSKVTAINNSAKKYTKKTKDVDDISLEGAEATFFSSRMSLKKVTAKMYGETYQATGEFYFENSKLIFAFIKHSQYDTQIGLEKPVKVVRIEERRFYFNNDELIRLLVGKKELKTGDENYDELKQSVESIGEKLLDAFRN